MTQKLRQLLYLLGPIQIFLASVIVSHSFTTKSRNETPQRTQQTFSTIHNININNKRNIYNSWGISMWREGLRLQNVLSKTLPKLCSQLLQAQGFHVLRVFPQVWTLLTSLRSSVPQWCYIMDPSFVLFSASKRVTLREEDMTVEKIYKIFQVWQSNVAYYSHTVSLPKIRNVS